MCTLPRKSPIFRLCRVMVFFTLLRIYSEETTLFIYNMGLKRGHLSFGGYPSEQKLWAFYSEHGIMLIGPPSVVNANGLAAVHMNSLIPDVLSTTAFKGNRTGCIFSQDQGNFLSNFCHYMFRHLVSWKILGAFMVLVDHYQISPTQQLFLKPEFHFTSDLLGFGHSKQ